MTSECGRVAVNHHFIFSRGSKEAIAVETLYRVPIEDKHEVSTHEREHLVVVFLPKFIHWESLEIVNSGDSLHHSVVKSVEEFVFQILAVYKLPLTACIFIAPAVPFAREVDPFGMSELITHKVEITTIDGSQSDKTYHLMESHAALHGEIVVVYHHVPIHLLIYKAEDYGFVSYEGLVMALAIRDCLLVSTTVCQLPEY